MGWLIGALVILLTATVNLYIMSRRAVKTTVPDKSGAVVSLVGLGVMLVLCIPAFFTLTWVLVLLHVSILGLVFLLVNVVVRRFTKDGKDKIRKYIHGYSLLPVLITAALITYGYFNMRNIVETDYTVSSGKLSENYTAAMIADLHFGTSTNSEKVEELCESISDKDVDMLMLCGDIVDESTTLEQMQDVFEILGNTKTKYGVFYVYGNHDRSLYTAEPNYTEQQLVSAIEDSGITILEDESVRLNDELTLIGRKDRSDGGRRNMKSLIKETDEDSFIIVMDHQPYDFVEKAESGADLQVSGHTHAGQIMPGGWFMKLFGISELYYGQETVNGMDAVVTSGASGWGFPIRTQKNSEYVIISIEGEK